MSQQPWILDRFDDARVLRYEVPGFESLPLNDKILIYYLAQATIAGQQITIDQNFKYNNLIIETFNNILENYKGDRTTVNWQAFERYAKRLWFSNGIHHHYSGAKHKPHFTAQFLSELIADSELCATITEIIFSEELYKNRVSHEDGVDLVEASACNYYDSVTQQEAEEYYAMLAERADPNISLGLNSRLTKDEQGVVYEQVYKLNGLYSEQIEQIIYWLEKAATVASQEQRHIIELLVEYYRTGELSIFDDYSIAWVKDSESKVDFINGFIEVYGDPLCRKGAWEGMVNFKNEQASHRTEIIAENAQWFEDRAPITPAYRKAVVRGVSAKVITAAMLGGDCYPTTPIGINLPNAEWIRRDYGSKSVTIDNITHAYAEASKGSGFTEEFFLGEATQYIINMFGECSDSLHTDLHECLGHGSGQLAPGVTQDALGSYHSVIEECRADLFGLYFMADQKMLELGLLPSQEASKAHYIKYITNGALTQLSRIELGDDVEQTHMRNRKIISEWVLEHSNGAVELTTHNGKSYIIVNDYDALRTLFGELLFKIQKMKSEGDFESAKALVEQYGVKIDQQRHKEIIERYKSLNIEPYNGFVNPTYSLVMNGNEIVDIDITYPTSLPNPY